MDAERLAEIRARLESTSPGPWRTYQNVNGYLLMVGRDGDSGTDSFPPINKSNADMEFCAHARTDIPDLLAEVERLRSLVGEPPPGSHPDEWQPTDAMRCARVVQALEERIDGTISLYLWDTVEPHGFAVATGRDIEPFVAPTLLAALEAALGLAGLRR